MPDAAINAPFWTLAAAAGAAIGVLYVIACHTRNMTGVHDLKVRVETIRADHLKRRQAQKDAEVIYAEPVSDGNAGRKAA